MASLPMFPLFLLTRNYTFLCRGCSGGSVIIAAKPLNAVTVKSLRDASSALLFTAQIVLFMRTVLR